MSIEGMETQIKWVKKRLELLQSEVKELDNEYLTSTFDDLDMELGGLIDECEDTISKIQDL